MLALILVVDLAGLLVGGLWLWRGGPRRWLTELLRLGVLGAAVGLIGLTLTWATTRDFFALPRIACHVLFCVLAPLTLARGVFLLWRRRWAIGALLVLGALAAEGTYVYARHVEPYRLQVRRHAWVSPRLQGLPAPLKVVVLADLQTDGIGAYEAEVFARLDAERADLVLWLGDYLQVADQTYSRQRELLRAQFAGLRHEPRYGVWALDGDTDTAAESLAGTAARPLVDATVTLPTDPPIRIWGLSNRASATPLTAAVLAEIAASDGLPIVMGHRPDYARPVLEGHADPGALFLAGHCHGGQVVIPGFGPPITLSSVARRHAAGGFFRFAASAVCISRGLGMERGRAPRIRFLCPPELVVLELSGPHGGPAAGGR